MKRDYQVLLGKDVLADLEVANEHLRLRCEQELKNLLMRMQTAFLRQTDSRQFAESFRRFWNSFIRSLGASLLLTGKSWPEDHEKTIQAATAEMGLDQLSLSRAQMVATGKLDPEPDALEQIWMATIENVTTVARFVDQLPVHCLAIEILESEDDD